MNILHLTLKRKWFDMIASGAKREEYREIKPYWDKRLKSKKYDAIRFRNGYSKNSPSVLVRLKALSMSLGIIEWGAPPGKAVYIFHLGEVIDETNEPAE